MKRFRLVASLFPAFHHHCLAFPSSSIRIIQPTCLPYSMNKNTALHSLLWVDDASINVLDYLPSKGIDLPPDFKELISEATLEHQTSSLDNHDNDDLTVDNILEVLDFEYKVSNKPITVLSNTTYLSKEEENKILAVCLFHQIPACVACQLLPARGTLRKALSKDGWRAISFPEGIRVQIRPNQVCSTVMEELPPRKVTVAMAHELLEKANRAEPPPLPKPPQTILQALEKEFVLTRTKFRTNLTVPFFPKDKFAWLNSAKKRLQLFLKKFQQITKQLNSKLTQAGRAGFLAYGFLNFALYAGGTVWQWRRYEGQGIAKLGKVLGSVYVGSQVTKLPRIALAVMMAPFGNRALEWLQAKLSVSEGQAFGMLTIGLIVSFFGVLMSLTVGSTVL